MARAGSGVLFAAQVLLGGVLLWEVALRSQMGVAISFMEEIWSRNLGHVFVSPLRRDGTGRVRDCWIVLNQPAPDGAFASDHFGLMAEIEIAPSSAVSKIPFGDS